MFDNKTQQHNFVVFEIWYNGIFMSYKTNLKLKEAPFYNFSRTPCINYETIRLAAEWKILIFGMEGTYSVSKYGMSSIKY